MQAVGETLGCSPGMSIAPAPPPFGGGVVGGLVTADAVQNGPADLVGCRVGIVDCGREVSGSVYLSCEETVSARPKSCSLR